MTASLNGAARAADQTTLREQSAKQVSQLNATRIVDLLSSLTKSSGPKSVSHLNESILASLKTATSASAKPAEAHGSTPSKSSTPINGTAKTPNIANEVAASKKADTTFPASKLQLARSAYAANM